MALTYILNNIKSTCMHNEAIGITILLNTNLLFSNNFY